MKALAMGGPPPGTVTAILLFAVALGIATFSLVDLARTKPVRYLEKPWWALIICLTIPWGGLAYLIFGRARAASPQP